MSADNNYAPFVATTMASICDNTKNFIDFYVLDGGINEENKEKILSLRNRFNNFSIEFISIDIDKYFSDFRDHIYIPKSAYNRLLIPNLKPNLKKVIYTDVDVILFGEIAELFNETLEDYTIGAVWEEFAEQHINVQRKKNLDIESNHKYFCAGNLLIDCQKWLEKDVYKNILMLKKNNINSMMEYDQSLLNKCFDNDYKQLSPKYCYINQNYYFYNSHDILIRHYNGPIKPWHINEKAPTNLLPGLKEFWKYAKMTEFYDRLNEATLDNDEQEKLMRLLRIRRIQYQYATRKEVSDDTK